MQTSHSTGTCTVTLHVVEPRTHQKFESFKKNPRRRKSNSNLLIHSKNPEIERNCFGPNGMVSSHQTRDLECFADSNNIPWNPPAIRCPNLSGTIPQMSLLSLCALPSQQSRLFPMCAALTYNDSRIVLHKICPNLKNCECK